MANTAAAIFLRDLFDHGRVSVEESLDLPEEALAELQPLLEDLDRAARSGLPRGWPPLEMPAACYGAVTLYQACQFLANRHHPPEAIGARIVIPPPRPNPVEHASVDLVMRFLPDAVRLARSAASEDPLVTRLLELGRRWPLSSVGIAGLGEVDAGPIFEHPVVARVYIDRIIASGDRTRMNDPRAREGVRAAVGGFAGELAGGLPLEEASN